MIHVRTACVETFEYLGRIGVATIANWAVEAVHVFGICALDALEVRWLTSSYAWFISEQIKAYYIYRAGAC